jgi:hypothetical protein
LGNGPKGAGDERVSEKRPANTDNNNRFFKVIGDIM